MGRLAAAALAAAALLPVPLAILGGGGAAPRPPAAEAAAEMAAAAKAFLAALPPEQRGRAQLAFEDEGERSDWHYTPRTRRGLPLGEIDGPSLEAALALLRAGLSERGFGKAETIRALEDVLVAAGESPRFRDKGRYHLTIFGDPAPAGTWGWRYEGHHVSLHWTIVEGRMVSTTPQFLGANPATVRSGPAQGTRALAGEEDLARQLLASLTAAQRGEAVLAGSAPADILTANARRAGRLAERGIPYARLAPAQQGRLWALIEEHAVAQRPELAAERLRRVREAGLDGVRFAWLGSERPGEGHYYRIQGPTFLVEYDNTQDGANHVHTVWREFDGDFGRDLLAEHYRTSPHHRRP